MYYTICTKMYLELVSFPGLLQLHAVIVSRSVQKQRYCKQSKMRAREGQGMKLLRMFSHNLLHGTLGAWLAARTHNLLGYTAGTQAYLMYSA